MGYDTKKQLRDRDNNLIAQFFDELLDDFRPLLGDEHGTYMQDVQAKAVLDDIYTRLGELTTEQKAEAIRLLLATIDGKVSTAAKQDAAKAVLDSIAGKDFATQATLAAVLTKLSADPSTSAKQDAAKLVLDTISTAVAARASEATLAQVKTELAAVKSELEAVKTNQLSGDQKVQLSGTITDLIARHTVNVTAFGVDSYYRRWLCPDGSARWTGVSLEHIYHIDKYDDLFLEIRNDTNKSMVFGDTAGRQLHYYTWLAGRPSIQYMGDVGLSLETIPAGGIGRFYGAESSTYYAKYFLGCAILFDMILGDDAEGSITWTLLGVRK